ncbi:MAG: hypothetical protein AAF830_09880 [Pseudomonadota bacterium]
MTDKFQSKSSDRFTTPQLRSKDAQDALKRGGAFEDLEAERQERLHKSERLRRLRLAAHRNAKP